MYGGKCRISGLGSSFSALLRVRLGCIDLADDLAAGERTEKGPVVSPALLPLDEVRLVALLNIT